MISKLTVASAFARKAFRRKLGACEQPSGEITRIDLHQTLNVLSKLQSDAHCSLLGLTDESATNLRTIRRTAISAAQYSVDWP